MHAFRLLYSSMSNPSLRIITLSLVRDQADALKKLPSPHTIDSALQGRCISGGAASPNVAQTATAEIEAPKKKRRKSNQESDFGVFCYSVAVATKAEGTGLEPATPYGALHFQ